MYTLHIIYIYMYTCIHMYIHIYIYIYIYIYTTGAGSEETLHAAPTSSWSQPAKFRQQVIYLYTYLSLSLYIYIYTYPNPHICSFLHPFVTLLIQRRRLGRGAEVQIADPVAKERYHYHYYH